MVITYSVKPKVKRKRNDAFQKSDKLAKMILNESETIVRTSFIKNRKKKNIYE